MGGLDALGDLVAVLVEATGVGEILAVEGELQIVAIKVRPQAEEQKA